MNIQPEFSQLLVYIYLVLHGFGWLYNWAVAWLEGKKYSEGYMGLIVAVGVGVTLFPFLFMGPVSVVWVYLGLVASGIPMMAGSIWRHVKAREKEQADERQAARVA